MQFEIAPEVFEAFPGMQIVAVVAKGLRQPEDTAPIEEALRAAWQSAGEAANAYGNPQSHPMIKPWGERMKAVGASRKQFPSSVEAMVRRAGKGGEPFRINPLVDFYNAVSLRHLVPLGAFDLAALETGLQLRFSRAGDSFLALDADEAVGIPAGEVSYADGAQIVTRHFVWKQGRHALLTEASSDVLFVSEILGELPAGTAAEVAAALESGLRDLFGLPVRAAVLDADCPAMAL